MNDEFGELFEKFKRQFTLTNPPPTVRRTSGLGWQFALSVIWAVFAVLMVASQTAFEFYQAKILSGMNGNLAVLASMTVLVAVEGGMVIGAAIKASGAKEYNRKLIVAAIVLCVLISISAGVNSSIGIIPNIDPEFLRAMRIALVFALGIGGSLVAWASGEVLGAQIARALIDRQLAVDELRETMQEYNRALQDSWARSPEYVLAKADVREQAAGIRQRQKLSESFRKFPGDDNPQNSQPTNDYRKLSEQQRRDLLSLAIGDIMNTYSLSDRTARNWRSFAERDFGNGHNN